MFDPFAAPPPTKWNFLSLGAGVQSSALALMAAHGEIQPTPDAAIFADTQAEPKAVYEWFDKLREIIKNAPCPYPVYEVTAGDLGAEAVTIKTKEDGTKYTPTAVPAFVKKPDGEKGMIPNRQCTERYKIKPIQKEQKRLADIKRGEKECVVTSWIGISWDEQQRMRISRDRWCQNRYPLIERRLTRDACRRYVENSGLGTPPRSACVFCPFRNDAEWRVMKEYDPESFAAAAQFDEAYRNAKRESDNFEDPVFIHPQLIPLSQIDFSNDFDRGQLPLWQDFNNECEGMCGV